MGRQRERLDHVRGGPGPRHRTGPTRAPGLSVHARRRRRRRGVRVGRSKVESFTGIIDRILEEDLRLPRKQRHTGQEHLRAPQGRVRVRRQIHHRQCHGEERSALEFTGHHTLTSKTVAGHLRLYRHPVGEQGTGDGTGPLRIHRTPGERDRRRQQRHRQHPHSLRVGLGRLPAGMSSVGLTTAATLIHELMRPGTRDACSTSSGCCPVCTC